MGNHRCLRSAGHPTLQPQHKPQIQADIQQGGNRQKDQRAYGIPDGTQIAGKIIIQKRPRNSAENHRQILPHQRPDCIIRDPKKQADAVQAQKGKDIQKHRQRGDEDKGGAGALPQPIRVPLSKTNGKHGPAAHAQPQKNRGQKGHQGEG